MFPYKKQANSFLADHPQPMGKGSEKASDSEHRLKNMTTTVVNLVREHTTSFSIVESLTFYVSSCCTDTVLSWACFAASTH